MKTKRWSATVLFGLVALTAVSCAKDETDTSATSATPSATSTMETPAFSLGLTRLASSQKSCGATPEATAGPYYVSGTRALTNGNLNYDDLDGTPIKIAGYVYRSDTNTAPVSGAKIEIWQADDAGAYHPQDQGSVSDFAADDISLRGYVTTNKDGFYVFSTILPGEYEGRVRHIHVRAEASGFQTKISQIIVAQAGDQIAPEDDMIARSFPSCSLASFTERDGVKTAVFNFHVQPQ